MVKTPLIFIVILLPHLLFADGQVLTNTGLGGTLVTIGAGAVTYRSTAVAAASCTNFTSDTFTHANGDLGGTTASGGGTWTARDTANTIIISANVVTSNNNGGRFGYYNSSTPTNADYTVGGDVATTTNLKTSLAVSFRMNTAADGDNYNFDFEAGTWSLNKRVSSVDTNLGTYVGDDPSLATKTVSIKGVGTTISATVAGTQRISVTDSAIAAKGQPALYNGFADTASAETIDNWTACQ